MPNPARRTIALAVLAVAIIAGAVALDLSSVAAQSEDEQSGRIVAQRLADGRTEFGWQPAGGERVLPRARYFPAEVGHQRWLNSSPVEVGGAEIGRINARRLSDGRIEFAFTPTEGERIEPSARYFPVDARVGRWLRSTEITISAAPATGFVAIAAGGRHTCAIRAGSGVIECWGWSSSSGQGIPSGSFRAVSAGGRHTCAIRAGSGVIECWGWSPSDPAAQQLANIPSGSFSAVSAGFQHMCAIHENGAIECWGKNTWTELTEETGEIVEIYHGQTDAPAGSFSAVSAGELHTCAIRAESGAIECWGENWFGQADAPAGSFSAVSAGGSHTCGLRESGAIECWGWSIEETSEGVEVYAGQAADAPTGSFSAVSAGFQHTCAIHESGAIECWGRNTRIERNPETEEFEEVYNGQTDAPTGSFSAVSAGGSHTCGLRESGAIECWGSNYFGQSSPPDVEGQSSPPTATGFTAVSAGRQHSCGLRTSGAIECWGSDDAYGQGYTYNTGQLNAPVSRDFSAVSVGYWRSCGLRESGEVRCWGSDRSQKGGYIGYVPRDAQPGSFSAVSVGDWHICGLRESGAIECWGANWQGQTDAPAGSFTAIAAGSLHTCAIRESGAIECWGENWTGQADAPAGSFSAVSAGDDHTCAIRTDGAITCWGGNDAGQTDAPAGSFSAVSAGGWHTCGLRESGAIECWGKNTWTEWNEETGEGVEVYAGQADAPAGSFSAVSAGGWHTCAIRAGSGTIECWGSNTRRK